MPNYFCPFCYKIKPQGYEPTTWACCGEVGRAVPTTICQKCSAELFDHPKACEVCGADIAA